MLRIVRLTLLATLVATALGLGACRDSTEVRGGGSEHWGFLNIGLQF